MVASVPILRVAPAPKPTDTTEPSPRWGRWAPIVDLLQALPPGKPHRIIPRLSKAEMSSLRSCALWRRRGLHFRNTPTETQVWMDGREREGFKKYRKGEAGVDCAPHADTVADADADAAG